MVAFVGWSGDKCEEAAQELIKLLIHCFSNFITFRISSNFPKGDGWRGKLKEQLDEAQFAILCLTADSRPDWLCYEAGALAEKTPIATVLFEETKALFSPLEEFQNVKFNKTEIQKLVETLHNRSFEIASELGVKTPHLDLGKTLENFRQHYPDFETNVTSLLRSSEHTETQFKMTAFVGCWGERCGKAADALVQLLTLCLGDYVEFQIAAEPSNDQLNEWGKEAAFSILCLTDESLNPWPFYAAGALAAKGVLTTVFFEGEAENLEELFPPMNDFLSVQFNENERANKNKNESGNETEFEKLVAALCDRYSEMAPHASMKLDKSKALQDLRQHFPDFEAKVKAFHVSDYTINEFEEDLHAIKDLGGNMTWPYEAGISLLGVLRSDKMSILEKALAIHDYREGTLAKYLEKYADRDNRISKLYANTGNLK